MSVKFQGVEVVPVEPWLVRAFHTLMTKDHLAHFGYWEDNDDPEAVPTLQPDQNGESGQYRMYLLDTDEGRKIVLYWSGMTVPVLDWSADNKDVDNYLDLLFSAKEQLEIMAPRKSYRTQRKFETQADLIGKWAELIDHARRFRNTLVGWSWDRESDLLDTTGHRYVDDDVVDRAVASIDPKVSFHAGQNDINQVGDSLYFQDVKVFKVETSPAEAERLATWCERQSQLAFAQFKTLGGEKDWDYVLEKRMKARINRIVGLALVKSALSDMRYGVAAVKAEFFSWLGLLPGREADKLWLAASRRAYLDHYRKTGEWRPPKSVDDLVRCARRGSLVFDYLLHAVGSAVGNQLTSFFEKVKTAFPLEKRNEQTFTHQKLIKFLPVREAQTRQTGGYFFRQKKSAWNHWLSNPVTSTPAPVAIPRPRKKKSSIGAMSLLDI